MVNQRLALQSGFTPCSTIKLVTSLAALTEHVVDKDTTLHLGRYINFNMTNALAKSNNQYFTALGNKLGFERVVHYAQMLALGEKAGLDVAGEQPGSIAARRLQSGAGVGLMTSFGRELFAYDAAGTGGDAFPPSPMAARCIIWPAVSEKRGGYRRVRSPREANAGDCSHRHRRY